MSPVSTAPNATAPSRILAMVETVPLLAEHLKARCFHTPYLPVRFIRSIR
jgi:hypothetical protein